MYRCICNKNYKTPYGLKNHAKQCNVNLSHSNPISLTELKATVVSSGKNGSSITTTKPTISVSLANVMPSPPPPPKSCNSSSNSSDTEMTNLMQEDDQLDGNLNTSKSCTMSIKAPTLQQHLLSPIGQIEVKSTITSQS